MRILPESVHPALSRRIDSTCFAARSNARSTSPRFASSYTRATRSASSPAPRLRSLPSSDSMIARTNRPWASWMVAISEVPTIAAAIAAIFFGSIVFGRAWAIRIPSRRAIVAPRTAGIRRSSVRMPCRTFVASPSISSHPDDHLGEDQEGVPDALVLRGDRRDHGHVIGQVHAVRDFLRRDRAGQIALVREYDVRNPRPDQVQHLTRPNELVRMARVDDEEDPAHLSGEDLEDEFEPLLTGRAEDLGLDARDVHVPVVEGDRRAHPVDADRFLGDRLDDRRLPGVERARDEDAREIVGQSNEVAERIRDPVRPDSVRLHLRDAHRVADDSAAEGRLKLDDEVGHRADLVEFALHQGPVDEEEADDRPGRAGRLDQLAPEPQDVLLGEPVHEELHRVDDDAAGPLRLHRGEDRFADRREAVDVVDVVLLTAREEELG